MNPVPLPVTAVTLLFFAAPLSAIKPHAVSWELRRTQLSNGDGHLCGAEPGHVHAVLRGVPTEPTVNPWQMLLHVQGGQKRRLLRVVISTEEDDLCSALE